LITQILDNNALNLVSPTPTPSPTGTFAPEISTSQDNNPAIANEEGLFG
jgi:hypothetical protein